MNSDPSGSLRRSPRDAAGLGTSCVGHHDPASGRCQSIAAPAYGARSSIPRRSARYGSQGDRRASISGEPPAAFPAGSSVPPSQASFSTIRARRPGEFSPIPAVNTKPSMPPSAAASRPACSPTR